NIPTMTFLDSGALFRLMEDMLIKLSGFLQLLLIGMPFCDSAHHLERPKSIISAAAVFTQNHRFFFLRNTNRCPSAGTFVQTIGIDKKDLFLAGQVLPDKIHHGFVEFKAI